MSTGTGDWSSGELDLDAYLRRIAYQGPTDPSGATLEALYRAHLAAVRFENLGLFIDGVRGGRPPDPRRPAAHKK